MSLITPEVLISIISTTGMIVAAMVGRAKTKQAKAAQRSEEVKAKRLEAQLRFQRYALSFSAFVDEWEEIKKSVQLLSDRHDITRWVLLQAYNGEKEPDKVTAYYQLHTDGSKPYTYINYEIDIDYVERLKHVEAFGHALVIPSKLPENAGIRAIYEREGVKEALWCFVARREIVHDGAKIAVLSYCSYATYKDHGLTPEAIQDCKVLTGRLKGLANNFD